jgi:hypothetical protein
MTAARMEDGGSRLEDSYSYSYAYSYSRAFTPVELLSCAEVLVGPSPCPYRSSGVIHRRRGKRSALIAAAACE